MYFVFEVNNRYTSLDSNLYLLQGLGKWERNKMALFGSKLTGVTVAQSLLILFYVSVPVLFYTPLVNCNYFHKHYMENINQTLDQGRGYQTLNEKFRQFLK